MYLGKIVEQGERSRVYKRAHHKYTRAHLSAVTVTDQSRRKLRILLEGDDYIGHSVNVAARLCDLARSGEVLVASGMVDHLPRWASVRGTAETAVRGLENPIPVARVGFRPLDGPSVPDPVCGIALTRAVAEAVDRDPVGEEVLFCSLSCHDTWQRRPRPAPEGQGSLRTPLIGS